MIIHTDIFYDNKIKYCIYPDGGVRRVCLTHNTLLGMYWWADKTIKCITIPQIKTTMRNKEYRKILKQSYGTKRKRW